jgi:hypothetical protein
VGGIFDGIEGFAHQARSCGFSHRGVSRLKSFGDGNTEWIPPPHLDHGQPRTNDFHHPEELLRAVDQDDP